MKTAVRYIVVDDNIVDTLLLQEYAAAYPWLEKVQQFENPEQAIAFILSNPPDLVFLDIEMKEATGLQVLKKIKEQVPMVVFITSHPEYALDGFELSALDYVLKPLTAERFAKTASRIKEFWEMKQKSAAYEVLFQNEGIVIREGYGEVKLSLPEIIYLEAMQDYTKVVTDKKQYLTLNTLKNFEEKLPQNDFLRIHRSYIVAVKRIREKHTDKVYCENVELPIGKTYRSRMNHFHLQ